MSEEDSGQQGSERRDEAEEMARLQEQINNLPVGEHILYMMHSLSALAVDRLGLSADGVARRDVQQSRLAIDAFRALLGVLEGTRPTEEIAAHRGVLSQLQLAYVGALGNAGSPEEGAAGPSVEADEAKSGEAPQPSKPRSGTGGATKKSGAGAAKTAKKSGGAGTAKTAKKSTSPSKRKGEKTDS